MWYVLTYRYEWHVPLQRIPHLDTYILTVLVCIYAYAHTARRTHTYTHTRLCFRHFFPGRPKGVKRPTQNPWTKTPAIKKSIQGYRRVGTSWKIPLMQITRIGQCRLSWATTLSPFPLPPPSSPLPSLNPLCLSPLRLRNDQITLYSNCSEVDI